MALHLSPSGLSSRRNRTPHPNLVHSDPDTPSSAFKVPRSYTNDDSRSRSPRRRQNLPQSRQPLVLPTVAQIPLRSNVRAPTPRRAKKTLDLTPNHTQQSVSYQKSAFASRPPLINDQHAVGYTDTPAPHLQRGRKPQPDVSRQVPATSDDTRTHVWVEQRQPRSRVPSAAGSSRPSPRPLIWKCHEEDDEDTRNRVRNTSRAQDAWTSLISRPTIPTSTKGRERGLARLAEYTPPSSSYESSRVSTSSIHVNDNRSREHSLTVDDSVSQRPSPLRRPLHLRSQSLSPYSTSSTSLSSDSSASSRSSSSSTLSSASTLITDPDSTLSPSSPACRGRSVTLLLTPSPSPSPPPVTRSPWTRGRTSLVTVVPRGRDPLSRKSLLAGEYSRPAELPRPGSAESPLSSQHGRSQSRLKALLSLAWSLSIPSTGNLLVDSYTPSREPTPTSPISTRTASTDSLGLDTSSITLTRPSRGRRRSSAASFDEPIVYHHHAKPPRKQKAKQAFGPCDIKPYGYRVGVQAVKEVFGVFCQPEEELDAPKSKLKARPRSASPSFIDLMLGLHGVEEDGMYAGWNGRGSASTFSSALAVNASAAGNKSKLGSRHNGSAPPSTVTLQRYPIIPYNPPPGSVKSEDEVFPKIRRSALWWKDMVPGGDDGRIDGSVELSADRAAGRGRGGRQPDGDQRLRRSERSPSPQRGRARCVTVRPSLLASAKASASNPPKSPSSKPIPLPSNTLSKRINSSALSHKYFRPPPQPVELASVYLVWALKGNTANSIRYGPSASDSWPISAMQRSPTPSPSRRKSGGKKGGVDGREGRFAKGVQALAGRRNTFTSVEDMRRQHACAVGSLLKWESFVEEGDGEGKDGEEENDVFHQRFGVDCEEESD